MKFAGRTQQIAPFLAMEFGKHAAALEAEGIDVVRMNLGEPDFGAPPLVVEAMQRALLERRTQYTEALGIQPLREAIAQHYAQHYAVTVDPAQVVVTAGASAALLLVCAALVEPGADILLADPSYPCNRHFISTFGGNPRLITTSAATRFQLNSELVEAHWSSRAQGVMIATPSNPTGTSVPFDELAHLCQFVENQGGYRIIDEIYLGLSYGAKPRSILSADPGAIVINSFSKYFSMTGWRLGWLVVPKPMLPVIEKLAQNLYICPSAPTQYAALACFEPESLAIYETQRLEFARRRDRVITGLDAAGYRIPVEPDGAFYVYMDTARFGVDSMTLARNILNEVHVALAPGHDFGPAHGAGHIRLSYATSLARIDAAIERLQRFAARFAEA